jgi:hypothetical protein
MNIYEHLFYQFTEPKFTIKNIITNHKNSDKIAVIVDPRFNPLIEGVIRNFMHFLHPQHWNLLIYGHPKNEYQIKEKFPNSMYLPIKEELIMYDHEENPHLSLENYNKLFLSKEFWESIPAENILVFQADCIMFRYFNPIFTEYDYVGANYYCPSDVSPIYGGANGGFSFRKKSAMIECIEKVNWEIIQEYRTQFYEIYEKVHHIKLNLPPMLKAEDVFFTHACEILQKRVPDKLFRSFFSIESDYNMEASVYHGWNKNYLPQEAIIAILQKSEFFSEYL